MAQDGDTITYTYNDNQDENSDLIPQQEDISSIDEIVIEYIDGAGAASTAGGSGSGGRVDNVVVDVSDRNTIYVWPAGISQGGGRYDPDASFAGASTEIWFEDTNQTDSTDEPFIAAAGGGGEGGTVRESFGQKVYDGGGGGARGGVGGSGADSDGLDAEGVAPPLGGDGGDSDTSTQTAGGDGEGAVNTSLAEVVDAGSTTTGGGSGPDTNGEVKISFTASVPNAPTNLSASVQ